MIRIAGVMRKVWYLFLFWVVSSAHFSACQLDASEGVRVATYNVWNYLVQDRRVEGRWLREYPKPEVEKSALRRTIHKINPDIIAFQEMGPGPFLVELQRDLSSEGLHLPYAIHMQAEDEQRHLAVLSRVAPLHVYQHKDMDFPYRGERRGMKRGLLEIVFPVPGSNDREWSLFVVHLKSRWTNYEEDQQSTERRTKEAQAARDRVLERYPGAKGKYLIVGDMNDYRDSSPLRRFLRRGDLDISRMLDAGDENGHTWTFYFPRKDRYDRVDFILASPDLESHVVGGRASVQGGDWVLIGSDHRAVYVDLFGE